MDPLTAFGSFAVWAVVACYAFEQRSRLFVLGFAASWVPTDFNNDGKSDFLWQNSSGEGTSGSQVTGE